MTVTALAPLADHGEAGHTLNLLLRDHGKALDEKTFAAVTDQSRGPVERWVRAAEALYAAAMAAKPSKARDAQAAACAQLALFCSTHGFHELGQTDRSLKMAGACRRLLGLGAQDEADDPKPLGD
jgi:hypothetical protein